MSDKIVIPGQGAHLYEVTLLAKGIDLRAASSQDFDIVHVRANNPIAAKILARNHFDAAVAFDAVLVEERQP